AEILRDRSGVADECESSRARRCQRVGRQRPVRQPMVRAARAAVEYRLGPAARAAATAGPTAVPTWPTARPAAPASLPAERAAPRTGPAASAASSAGPALPAGCGRLRAASRGAEEALGTDRTLRRDRDRPR